MATSRPAIHISQLHKRFGKHHVLKGVDLTVPEGSVFALLGPNGAGKTTIVNILSTLLSFDTGEVRVGGHRLPDDPVAVRRMISVTGQFSAIDELLTGRENLTLMAKLGRIPRRKLRGRVDEMLERFDLVDAADRRAGGYSGGMIRRLDIAASMLSRPTVLFLDEPTTGLDPRSRQAVWEFVSELVADGVTVFLTTQYLDEADHLADRIAVLDDGHIVANDVPAVLKRRVGTDIVGVHYADGQTLRLPTDGSFGDIQRTIAGLDAHSRPIANLTIHTPSLDDVFLSLTGSSADDRDKKEVAA